MNTRFGVRAGAAIATAIAAAIVGAAAPAQAEGATTGTFITRFSVCNEGGSPCESGTDVTHVTLAPDGTIVLAVQSTDTLEVDGVVSEKQTVHGQAVSIGGELTERHFRFTDTRTDLGVTCTTTFSFVYAGGDVRSDGTTLQCH